LDDASYRRYTEINLPHARTVALRVTQTLEALGAFGSAGNGDPGVLRAALRTLDRALAPYADDPPAEEALAAADGAAEEARDLVDAVIAGSARSDRLGQHVRNLFECLGLAEEGRTLSLLCGESPDSPLR
jgi:hypothetical protein